MNCDEALAAAKAVAEANQWPWLEPVTISKRRRYLLAGPVEWNITTNAAARGGNVRIGIDDGSGALLYAGLAPR